MKIKSIVFFLLAIAVSLLASGYRWGDSAHSIGLIEASGGSVRHPAFLGGAQSGYMLIATARVVPPYSGDVRVALEGEPRIEHRIFLSGPVVDLGMRRNPALKGNVIHGLEPDDRLALWVLMKPPLFDPVCGMPYEEGFLKSAVGDSDSFFCSESCSEAFRKEPGKYGGGLQGRYNLVFYDVQTNRAVLNVPVIFRGKGGSANAGGHNH